MERDRKMGCLEGKSIDDASREVAKRENAIDQVAALVREGGLDWDVLEKSDLVL